MDIQANNKSDLFKGILESKLNTPLDELCKGFDCNRDAESLYNVLAEFVSYISYCRNLRFEEEPDYIWIKNLFRNLYFKEFEKWDNVFD